jgi:hypothetical protein
VSAEKVFIGDTETVTLDADTGLIWEIGLVNDGTGEEYLWQLRPDLPAADPNSVRFSDYYERCQVASKPPGSAVKLAHPKLAKGKRQFTSAHLVAFEVATLLAKAMLVGAVPDFDARMFRAWLRQHNQVLAAHYHIQDIETMVYGYLLGQRAAGAAVTIPDLPLNSDALSLAVGVDPAQFERHTALGDCRWTRAQLNVVLGRQS